MKQKWMVISQEEYDNLAAPEKDMLYMIVSIAPWWRPFKRRRDKAFYQTMLNGKAAEMLGYSIYDVEQTKRLYSQEEADGQDTP